MTDAHYTHSTLRERIAEHVFVGDALRMLWRLGIHDVEVLRLEFDAHGYDLVMARGLLVRPIQFKTGTAKRPSKVCLARVLAEKPSGCAIWMRLDQDLNMGPYFWFGAPPPGPAAAGDRRLPKRASPDQEQGRGAAGAGEPSRGPGFGLHAAQQLHGGVGGPARRSWAETGSQSVLKKAVG